MRIVKSLHASEEHWTRAAIERLLRSKRSIGGAVCVLGGVVFATKLPALRQQARPIYVRLGILPEIAEGLRSASQLSTPPED